jgi:hypothetical protein
MPDDKDPTAKSEVEQSSEAPSSFVVETEKLFGETGFLGSADLSDATTAVLAGLSDPETPKASMQLAWIELSDITEGIVDSAEQNGRDRAKAQIAAIIHKALIFKSAGDQMRYLMEIDLAEVYADNINETQLSTAVTDEIDAGLEGLEMSSEVLIIKLRYSMSESNREDLRGMFFDGDDFQAIREDAYARLIKEEKDPYLVLRNIGALD